MAADLDRVDEHARRSRHDLVSETTQRDRSGDALRDLHLAQVGEARSPVAHARRDDQARRYERRSRADEREERFEEARPTFEDVDEVDAAGAGSVVPALDPHERRDGMCPVG